MLILDEFNIYTREAGPGVLSVAIEGPSKAAVQIVENPNGYTLVSYIVSKEGLSQAIRILIEYIYHVWRSIS